LGVGCPLPQDVYVPEPPKPCWYETGEAGCPDPATEECDKIIRTMHKITKQVQLTVGMGECFSTDLLATDITHSLKYHCISKGIMDAAGYEDSHITSENYLTNPNYKRYHVIFFKNISKNFRENFWADLNMITLMLQQAPYSQTITLENQLIYTKSELLSRS